MMFVCVCVVFFHDTSANKKKFSDGLELFGLSVNQQNTKFDPSPMNNFVSGCMNFNLTLFDCVI